MFGQIYSSENKKFCLYITITCKGTKKFRVWAEDYGKKNSKYADREVVVEGKRTIFFNFAVSPKEVFIGCLNSENLKDKEFEVSLMSGKLNTYNIWLDSNTKEFLKLCIPFCQRSGFEQASDSGRMINNGTDFNIRYFNAIRDIQSGSVMNTPARIGHKTGIIEVAKVKFDAYTIPMRVVILLHEFSHKYKNPKMGLEISNEVGADINALYIYLGLGFSKIDAICVFANVFLKAQTPSNVDRMRKIMDYIQKFENQEFAELN